MKRLGILFVIPYFANERVVVSKYMKWLALFAFAPLLH